MAHLNTITLLLLIIAQTHHNIIGSGSQPEPTQETPQQEQDAPDQNNQDEVSTKAPADELLGLAGSSDFFSLFQDLEKLEILEQGTRALPQEKEWTFITYMAADNDLAHFARRNLVQQTAIGSSATVNVVTQLDTRMEGNKKVTKRYYIEQGKLILTNIDDPATQKMDSGSPQTLIDCIRWAVKNYPARHYALILWNHGTGIIDIGRARMINASNLFNYNTHKGIFELDRSIHFLELIEALQAQDLRGICFDDSTGHYLTNQDLEQALSYACTSLLNGKKLDIIAFDACLMAMLEVADIVKKYAHYMVSSQEVELGTGYNYQTVLATLDQAKENRAFAKNIVAAYDKTYERVTGDYTQSAIDLSLLGALETNVDAVAQLLIECIQNQKGTAVTEAIKTSRHKLLCTHFDEPSYIDLHHFFSNILSNLKLFTFGTPQPNLISMLRQKLQEGLALIDRAVIANVAGKNLKQARGVSIYFPERAIHPSYPRTNFATSNTWYAFLRSYLKK